MFLIPFCSIFISKIKLITYYNWFKLHHQHDKMGSIALSHPSYLSTPLLICQHLFESYDTLLIMILLYNVSL